MLTPESSIDDIPLLYLDVETTGLNPAYGDRIIEVGALRCEYGEIVGSLEQLVNPQRGISSGAFAVNGISNEMLADAPMFHQIIDQLTPLMEGAVIVGHNVGFDLSFLAAEFAQIGLTLPEPVALDTCRLARQCFVFPSYSLTRLADFLGIEVGTAHRAMADVLVTRELFNRIAYKLWRRGVRTLEAFVQAQGGLPGYEIAQPRNVPPLVQEALRRNTLLRLSYTAESGEITDRLVRPLKLTTLGGNLSIVAYCYLRHARRNFRLDRIVAMELVESFDTGGE
ncbi:MAG: WYL domain-containing protein [Chloroflexi bacterium]|jgi:DNA polymerase-3 subunit epsilon|nr:WYL domain-containing protein [Chloroflexota bacterium]